MSSVHFVLVGDFIAVSRCCELIVIPRGGIQNRAPQNRGVGGHPEWSAGWWRKRSLGARRWHRSRCLEKHIVCRAETPNKNNPLSNDFRAECVTIPWLPILLYKSIKSKNQLAWSRDLSSCVLSKIVLQRWMIDDRCVQKKRKTDNGSSTSEERQGE